MLNDAKQRNDVLGQAYAALHAEYVTLKNSQIKDYTAELYGQASMAMPGSDRLDMDLYMFADLTPATGANYPLQ